MARRKKSPKHLQPEHKKQLSGSRHDKRARLDRWNPLRRITSRAIVPLIGAMASIVGTNIDCRDVKQWAFKLVELATSESEESRLTNRSNRPWDNPDRPPSHADRRRAIVRYLCYRRTSAIQSNCNLSARSLTPVIGISSASILRLELIKTGASRSSSPGVGSRPWLPLTQVASSPIISM